MIAPVAMTEANTLRCSGFLKTVDPTNQIAWFRCLIGSLPGAEAEITRSQTLSSKQASRRGPNSNPSDQIGQVLSRLTGTCTTWSR
jgi:hypothetical protein